MNADGTDIHQITFNRSSDLYSTGAAERPRAVHALGPRAAAATACTCTPPTRTAPTRSCTTARCRTRPAPTATGRNDTPIEFMRAREMSDGRLMVLVRERTDVDFGGNLTIIDANTYVENTQPLAANAGMPGPAQTPATLNDVRTIPGPSPGGRFESGFPLWDGSGRILVSWSQCRLLDSAARIRRASCPATTERLADPNAQTAPPLYSIWMFTPVAEHHPAGDGAGRRRHGHRGASPRSRARRCPR